MASLAFLACFASLVVGQAAIQSTSWNSTFELSADQIKLANLSDVQVESINNILNFDRTLLANGGPYEDDFYKVPAACPSPKHPGKLLKLQKLTDPAPYAIPATTSMSRFLYTTTDVNGTLVPASAYILWPYHAKKFDNMKGNKAPSVLWTHGTSGWYPTAAPSAHRSLFYQDFVPFALALAGYAVISPDYAGLGVGKSWDGTGIPHQYGAYQAGAGDALNAMRAALEAFPDQLTSEYVNLGHSQGGAVGWGVPEMLAQKKGEFKDLAKGHLGTILFAPPTDGFSLPPNSILVWSGKVLDKIYPEFNLSDWLTPLGIRRVELLDQIEGSLSVSAALFSPEEAIVQPDWEDTWAVKEYSKIANPGNRPWKGPMLIIQGDKDPAVDHNTTMATAKETCREYKGDLEFMSVRGVGHFPGMYATRSVWMDWLEARFRGRRLEHRGCIESEVERFLPEDHYQPDANAFPQWVGQPQWAYEIPQGH